MAKYTIFIRAIFIFVCSILMILGLTVATNHDLVNALNSGDSPFAFIILTVSAFMIAAGLLGVIGGINEATSILKIFFALIVLEILLQIGGALTAYYMRNDQEFKKDIWNLVTMDTKYYLQKQMKCCGFYNYTEYGPITTLAAFPKSCFINGKICKRRLYMEPCWDKIKKWLEDNIAIWMGVIGSLAAFEMWSIFLAASLLMKLKIRKMVVPACNPTPATPTTLS